MDAYAAPADVSAAAAPAVEETHVKPGSPPHPASAGWFPLKLGDWDFVGLLAITQLQWEPLKLQSNPIIPTRRDDD